METLDKIATIIVAIVFTWCIIAGIFEWARAKKEERKLYQESHQAAKAQREFWEKASKEAQITLTHKENNQ